MMQFGHLPRRSKMPEMNENSSWKTMRSAWEEAKRLGQEKESAHKMITLKINNVRPNIKMFPLNISFKKIISVSQFLLSSNSASDSKDLETEIELYLENFPYTSDLL